MTTPSTTPDRGDHFAHCVQVLGGVTAASRRLGVDERAIRRFINGERPLSDGMMDDTGKALRLLASEASEAERGIAAILASGPGAP